MKIEICAALCVRVFWTGVKNVAMLAEDIQRFKSAYIKTTNLLLDLNPTFNNCISTLDQWSLTPGSRTGTGPWVTGYRAS